MTIKEILESKNTKETTITKGIVGKKQFNGNYHHYVKKMKNKK